MSCASWPGPMGVENATDLLIDAADGMRVINEAEQLAVLEYAACQRLRPPSSVARTPPGHDRAARLFRCWVGMACRSHVT